MLSRRAVFKATESISTRWQIICMTNVKRHRILSPLLPQRLLHSTPARRDFLGYLVGDHHHARVHKEIGLLLEDYDNALLRYYTGATEAVISLCVLFLTVKSIINSTSRALERIYCVRLNRWAHCTDLHLGWRTISIQTTFSREPHYPISSMKVKFSRKRKSSYKRCKNITAMTNSTNMSWKK
jgi:hypothetical protein